MSVWNEVSLQNHGVTLRLLAARRHLYHYVRGTSDHLIAKAPQLRFERIDFFQ